MNIAGSGIGLVLARGWSCTTKEVILDEEHPKLAARRRNCRYVCRRGRRCGCVRGADQHCRRPAGGCTDKYRVADDLGPGPGRPDDQGRSRHVVGRHADRLLLSVAPAVARTAATAGTSRVRPTRSTRAQVGGRRAHAACARDGRQLGWSRYGHLQADGRHHEGASGRAAQPAGAEGDRDDGAGSDPDRGSGRLGRNPADRLRLPLAEL